MQIRHSLLALVLGFTLTACGGGGSGNDATPKVGGAPGGGAGGGTGGGGTGGGGTGGGTPASPFGSAPVKVVCEHAGGAGTTDYRVGPGQDHATLGEVPWENLKPGDTVRIFYRELPYNEKIFLINSGTEAEPIRVCGVPSADGKLPVITGKDATTRAALGARLDDSSHDYSMQRLGVVTVIATEFGERVTHIVIEGLSITGTLASAADDSTNFFFDDAGTKIRWFDSASCLRIQRASHLVIRGNEISGCGNGLFTLSKPDDATEIVRNVLVEGNYIHDNSLLNDDQCHQAYLQGVDFTIQYNYFGETRHRAGQDAGGNDLKTRIAGLFVRYNFFDDAANAHLLDLVEIEDFASHVFPWLHNERIGSLLAGGEISQNEANAANLLQQADYAKYQNVYIYGNLFHLHGARAPSNPLHIGFDNTAMQRQPGRFWFYNNTYLAEIDRSGSQTLHFMNYGSDFGDGGYYDPYDMATLNAVNDTELHYITDASGDICEKLTTRASCKDWGPMLPHTQEFYGRMQAYNNAIVLLPLTPGAKTIAFELTRFRWDQLELNGGNWISDTWDTRVDATGNTQQPGFGVRDNPWAWPGGNEGHHVSGANSLIEGAASPIVLATFEPLSGSPLLGQAVALPAEIPDSLRPSMQIVLDRSKPGNLVISQRPALTTIGAVETASTASDPGPGSGDVP